MIRARTWTCANMDTHAQGRRAHPHPPPHPPTAPRSSTTRFAGVHVRCPTFVAHNAWVSAFAHAAMEWVQRKAEADSTASSKAKKARVVVVENQRKVDSSVRWNPHTLYRAHFTVRRAGAVDWATSRCGEPANRINRGTDCSHIVNLQLMRFVPHHILRGLRLQRSFWRLAQGQGALQS